MNKNYCFCSSNKNYSFIKAEATKTAVYSDLKHIKIENSLNPSHIPVRS